jgi:pyrroloquinoline quinone (PQQ) biosynthesis protein C
VTFHDRLLAETGAARTEFLSIPLLGRALRGAVSRQLYLGFLTQAYHHVRHTCPLLALAAARTEDPGYRAALFTYIAEEQGHDAWILDDIVAMGGDADLARREQARAPCRAMVAYAYYAVERISPYALLGMVHVLEGMSVVLATKAATALLNALGAGSGDGFRYLTSHGDLDVGHVELFRELVNGLTDPHAGDVIIDCANVMYWLYGNIFRDLDANRGEDPHAT